MKRLFFFLPFQYFYVTRIKSLPVLINWIFIYVVPIFILFYSMSGSNAFVIICLSYILIVLAIYSIYEAGYIQNDSETIKFESNPTLRLSKEQLEYYEDHKTIIYLIRLLFSFIFGIAALFLIGASEEQIFLTFTSLMFIGVTYLLYNNIRNLFTLVLLFILVSLRYTTPLFLVYTKEWTFYLLLIVVLYPILNLLDWLYKPQFKQYALPFSQMKVRIVYYFLLSMLFSYLYYATLHEQYKVAMILSIYFFFYRIVFRYVSMRKSK